MRPFDQSYLGWLWLIRENQRRKISASCQRLWSTKSIPRPYSRYLFWVINNDSLFISQLSFCNMAVRETGLDGFIGLAFEECGFQSKNSPFDDRFRELSIKNSIICHSRRIRYVAVVARLNLQRLFAFTLLEFLELLPWLIDPESWAVTLEQRFLSFIE